MAGGCDEVKQSMDTIVPESWSTLNSRFLGKNVIILSLKVAHDLAKGRLVIDLVAEAGCVDDRQRDSCAFLIKFELWTVLARAQDVWTMRPYRLCRA
jgi:hypothetical protein